MTAAIVAASSSAETPHDSKPRRCELTWVSMVVSTLACRPAMPMRRSPPPPGLVGKILERQEHAVEEPGAELTEAVVALERRQVGDAEEFPVLGEEGEESLRKSGCGIATLPRRIGDEARS